MCSVIAQVIRPLGEACGHVLGLLWAVAMALACHHLCDLRPQLLGGSRRVFVCKVVQFPSQAETIHSQTLHWLPLDTILMGREKEKEREAGNEGGRETDRDR